MFYNDKCFNPERQKPTCVELLAQNLRECLWQVLQEANEIPVYGKQTYGDGTTKNGHVLENEDEEQDTYFDLTQLKEHFKTLPPNERYNVKDFESLRNLANGQDPNEGMSEIDMVRKELEDERENRSQPEAEN